MGTGFLIGPENILFTARHVVQDQASLAAMVVIDGEWRAFPLRPVWEHPQEDLAALLLTGFNHAPSWLRLSRKKHHASGPYDVWGYPDDVLYDFGQRNELGGALPSPDLIFTRGYFRRRFSGAIPGLIGQRFLELSEVAGSGCSGGPVITQRGEHWLVSGIYLGERRTQVGDGPIREWGYALRLDDISVSLSEAGFAFAE
ncbi:MAG: serine protease [Caulobacteraceae bacterium]|nr:serine protease [Caulobacteraceae bacterium]